jgi:hypothetical protein
MLNIFRGNEIFKGITFGFLSLFILEFGTIAVLAGFNTEGIYNYENIQYYYLLLAFNAIIAGLLGTGIALKLKKIKRLAYILNLIVFLMIIAGYGYFVWHRISEYVPMVCVMHDYH